MKNYIHHYTTIKNLALILDSKKIRFTRFDKLDDIMEEGAFPEQFRIFATNCFVSSWTDDIEESIPLWKMYASIEHGVRISLPIDMFKKHTIEPFEAHNHGCTQLTISPFSKDETYYNGKYYILNCFSDKMQDFYKKVEYVNNIENVYNNLFKYENGRYECANIWDLGKFKSTKWGFQNEVRFTIITNGLLPLSHPNINGDKIRQYDRENVGIYPNPETYIDVSLNKETLENMIITLAPCASKAEEIITKVLINNYIGNIPINKSKLSEVVRK